MNNKITLPTDILDDDLICFGDQCWSGKEFRAMTEYNKLEKQLRPLKGDSFNTN